jgi:hypothetical protein
MNPANRIVWFFLLSGIPVDELGMNEWFWLLRIADHLRKFGARILFSRTASSEICEHLRDMFDSFPAVVNRFSWVGHETTFWTYLTVIDRGLY